MPSHSVAPAMGSQAVVEPSKRVCLALWVVGVELDLAPAGQQRPDAEPIGPLSLVPVVRAEIHATLRRRRLRLRDPPSRLRHHH